MAYFRRLSYDARAEALQREYEAAERTLSWRITQPLRVINKWRTDRGQPEAAPARQGWSG
jgi:hypothetical protein